MTDLPGDPNQLAKSIIDTVTGQQPSPVELRAKETAFSRSERHSEFGTSVVQRVFKEVPRKPRAAQTFSMGGIGDRPALNGGVRSPTTVIPPAKPFPRSRLRALWLP